MSRIARTLSRTMPSWMRKRVNRVLQPLGTLIPAEDRASSLTEYDYRVRVTQLHQETPRALTITFEMLEGYRLIYRSGQFVKVSVPIGPTLFQRCYSFSSAPDDNRYSITVQTIFQGRLSRHLVESLRVGDEFYISEPAGEFVLPQERLDEQRYVLVAAGSGIVPVFSLLKDLLGKNPAADIQLIYACRTPDQCLFRRELERLEKLHPGFRLHLQFTRKEGNQHDPARRLDGQRILDRIDNPANALFYLCGPYGLVKKCLEVFHGAGIDESRIRIELFNAPPAEAEEIALRPRLVTFLPPTLLGRVRHVRQRQVESLLETARSAGIDIPAQCTAGSCKACKLKVKSGSVILDEPNQLTLEEAREGYVLSCVAYPCENLVVQTPNR